MLTALAILLVLTICTPLCTALAAVRPSPTVVPSVPSGGRVSQSGYLATSMESSLRLPFANLPGSDPILSQPCSTIPQYHYNSFNPMNWTPPDCPPCSSCVNLFPIKDYLILERYSPDPVRYFPTGHNLPIYTYRDIVFILRNVTVDQANYILQMPYGNTVLVPPYPPYSYLCLANYDTNAVIGYYQNVYDQRYSEEFHSILFNLVDTYLIGRLHSYLPTSDVRDSICGNSMFIGETGRYLFS